MRQQFKVCEPVFIRPLGRRGIVTWVLGSDPLLYSVASYGETRTFEGASLAPLEPLMRLVVSRSLVPEEFSGQCA